MRDTMAAATGLFTLPDIPESPSPGMAHRADADCQGWRTQCHTYSTFLPRAQACAKDFSIRAPRGGVPPGDTHGGNRAEIQVLRRLWGRDKSVAFGEYPGPISRS